MEVISGTKISGEVLQLIDGAKQFLVLVSPYFDPWGQLSTALKSAATRPNMKVKLLIRGGDDSEREKRESRARQLESYGVVIEVLERLHAKVYVSESQAIMTSMNLLKSSALDSWEIAMRVDRARDAAAYVDVLKHTGELLQRAKDESRIAVHPHVASGIEAFTSVLASSPASRSTPVTASPHPSALAPSRAPAPVATARPAPASIAARKRVQVGHCIRCSDEIAFDAEHPYCADCYKSWSKYRNPDYDEKHCHSCGKAKATTMVKPLCKPCWEATT